jgi:hypothetical membrane protein
MTPYLIIAATASFLAILTWHTAPAGAGRFAGRTPLLVAAVLVPFAYFGAQVAAAPYFPGYDALYTSASALGSDLSTRPGILNTGAVLTGVLALLGSIGFAFALPRAGTGRPAAFALALCLASAGLAAIWAGLHPQPSPRHDPGMLAFGMFVAPFVAAWAVWHKSWPRALRVLLLLDAAAFLLLLVAMSGVAGLHVPPYPGLVQKLLAGLSFLPATAVAAVALRR